MELCTAAQWAAMGLKGCEFKSRPTLNVDSLDWGVRPPNGSLVWRCLQLTAPSGNKSKAENKFHTRSWWDCNHFFFTLAGGSSGWSGSALWAGFRGSQQTGRGLQSSSAFLQQVWTFTVMWQISTVLKRWSSSPFCVPSSPPPAAGLSVSDQDSGVEDEDLSPRPSPNPHLPAPQVRGQLVWNSLCTFYSPPNLQFCCFYLEICDIVIKFNKVQLNLVISFVFCWVYE